jgi:hypothetical protein
LVAAAGMVLTGWLIATVVRHGGDVLYDLPSWAVAVGAGAAAVAFIGWMVIIRTTGWTGIAVAVIGALVVASIGVIPILGVLLFVGGMVWMAGSAQAKSDRRGLAGGLLVAIGLPLAGLVASDGPIVRCRPDGVSTSSSIFRDAGGSSGSGSSGAGVTSAGLAPGATQGQLSSGGRTYTYRCEGDRLVEFTRNP